MHILVAGCGDIGSRFGRLMVADKCQVSAIRRQIDKLPEEFKPVKTDLFEGSYQDIPTDIDYLVFTSAAKSRDERHYRETYLLSMQRLLEFMQKNQAPIRRVFFTSSTAVYHQTEGEWVDEDSPTQPTHFSGQIMLEAEQALKDSGYASTSVRYGGIYGTGRERLLKQVVAGYQCEQDPVVHTNRIHQDDCAGVLAHLINLDQSDTNLESLYVATDDNPASMYEVTEWIRDQLKLGPATSEPAAAGRGSKRCSNQRLKDSGYSFLYPTYQQGYSALISDWRTRIT